MESKRVICRIDQMGNVVTEAEGFHGQGCEAATAPIERALTGGEGFERTFKPEWAQTGNEDGQEDHMML